MKVSRAWMHNCLSMVAFSKFDIQTQALGVEYTLSWKILIPYLRFC